MKLTVKHNGTEIIYDESDNSGNDRKTSIKWSDQNLLVIALIQTITSEIKKLQQN